MKHVIRGHERGAAHFGWLKSRHTYSFGDYFHPQRNGFAALKVVNEDIVAPGRGFDTHCHRDMEIISYVLSGAILHKDSMGNERTSTVGEIQLLSAGKGVFHSEFNASDTGDLVFLQIWVEPQKYAIDPNYQHLAFDVYSPQQLLVTPDGRNGTLQINQDVHLSSVTLLENESSTLQADVRRGYYIHLIFGQAEIAGTSMRAGDGIELENITEISIRKLDAICHLLVMDMPLESSLRRQSI